MAPSVSYHRLGAVVAAGSLVLLRSAMAQPVLTLVANIPLPHVTNQIGAFKFDHLDADLAGQRLFVSCKENNTIGVIDMATNTYVGARYGVAAPQGILVVPSLGLVLSAGDDDGALHAFSLDPPFALRWRVEVGGPNGGADNIDYDPATGLAWVGFGDDSGSPSGALAYINISATNATLLGSIPYPGGSHPEEFHLSSSSSLIYGSCPQCNSTVVVISRVTKAIITSWPLLPAASDNYAMELDAAHDRIFLGTYGSTPGSPAYGHPLFLVLNMFDGSIVWSMPVTTVCDSIKYDSRMGRIYASCGGSAVPSDPSVLYVIQQTGADKYALLGTAPLPAPYLLARTIYFDVTSSTAYLAVPFNNALSPVQEAAVLVFRASAADSSARNESVAASAAA